MRHLFRHKTIPLIQVQDDGTGPDYNLPSTDKPVAAEPPTPTGDSHEANGHAPEDDEKRWERVGWAPQFGMPGGDVEDEGTLLDHQTWIEGKLDEKFYGGTWKRGRTWLEISTDWPRLVPQCRNNRLHGPHDLRYDAARRRAGLDFYNHGFLRHILPHIHSASAAQLQGRHQPRIGSTASRDGY